MRIAKALNCALVCLLAACGGGGGSSSSGSPLLVTASVTSNTCNDRLAPVTQTFTFQGGTLDTGIFNVPASDNGGVITAQYSDSTGSCSNTYSVTLDTASGDARLTSTTNCADTSCETTWVGTVAESGSADFGGGQKIRGENCNPDVPSTVGYRPSSFECNGGAAVLLSDNQRNNYSVVVRRNGQFNDRDPNNPTCGTNECSPYKTQKRIELPAYQVNCLGDSGFSSTYSGVNRISIKYYALIADPNDPSQFEQYCLTSTTTPLH